jgi:hypothetical protein
MRMVNSDVILLVPRECEILKARANMREGFHSHEGFILNSLNLENRLIR